MLLLVVKSEGYLWAIGHAWITIGENLAAMDWLVDQKAPIRDGNGKLQSDRRKRLDHVLLVVGRVLAAELGFQAPWSRKGTQTLGLATSQELPNFMKKPADQHACWQVDRSFGHLRFLTTRAGTIRALGRYFLGTVFPEHQIPSSMTLLLALNKGGPSPEVNAHAAPLPFH